MTVTIDKFHGVLERMGSDVTFHREEGGDPCPCRTPEGFRDPAWHRANPAAPVCNEQGFLNVVVTEAIVKAAVQPAATGQRRLVNERADALLGDVQRDDRLGIFPVTWNGFVLNFEDWSEAGEDYILFDSKRYIAVAADKIPDIDGDPNHHWEVGLRLVRTNR